MKKYNLYAGLGGGFGGANYHITAEFENEDIACEEAYRLAVEEYESMAGCHGLLTEEEIIEEYIEENGEEPDEDTVKDLYNNEVEGWISYHAVAADNDPDWDYELGRSNK